MPADQDFAAFYEANYERLVVQLFSVTGNLDDAEDVVQEAFARACQRWRRLRAYDLPAAWVRRVAFNLAVQGRRSRGLAHPVRPQRSRWSTSPSSRRSATCR